MNIKKMFTTLSAMVVAVTMTMPSVSVFAATYSDELQGAYDWAHEQGITTQPTIDSANMYGNITRAEMAKMLSVYAVKVLGLTADEAKTCEFSDIESVKNDLHDYIIESCQLGIMGQNIKAFRPYDTLSRAEFGTALSRVLWGNKYEGGTPYYAKHLDALKAAGIMNQIANAESTKEVRGYVMLMLQRSEANGAGIDCEDADVVVACLKDLDNCPAACKAEYEDEGETSDEVVKSGSLVVSAEATSSRSAVRGAASDLDTLTFKTSEEVEITKVVLERYGYSTYTDIETVRLENSDGTIVAEGKSVNSKDQVTLSIKKDYRKVDGSADWTIVTVLTGNSGSTIGFKVVDVTSTAKDVDLGNYKPYTYDIVDYNAVKVTLDDKGSDKDYNYEEGESYEVAKLKIKANSSALEVNGFTLSNILPSASGTRLELKDFVKEVEVVVDGKALKGTSFKADDDELTISFDSVEIAAKGNETFTVNITLSDFDEYGQGVQFAIEEPNDVKIVEKKTGARVSVENLNNVKWHTHFFNGSKIKLTGKKLGSVDAAQGSDDIVVLEGDIEVAEALKEVGFILTGEWSSLSGDEASADSLLEEVKVMINGDEYTPTSKSWIHAGTNKTGYAVYTFSKIEIEESGKIQVLIDVDDSATQSASVVFKPTFNRDIFVGSKYTESKKPVQTGDVKGSISFATRVTIQPSKASLENNLTKRVEFTSNETSKKTVFDGTYTAKKGDVYLNTAIITGGDASLNKDVTFYLYIDEEEVATIDPLGTETFADILVKAGESVKVKVEAEVSSDSTSATVLNYSLILYGNDDNDNDNSGRAEENLTEMKVVEKGTFNISTSATKNTVLLKARNTTIAEFTIKPSNNNEGLTLDEIMIAGTGGTTPLTSTGIRLRIDGVEYDADDAAGTASGIVYPINEEIASAGVKAEIILKDEYNTGVVVEITYMNGLKQNKEFKKSYADALVYIDSQQNQGDFTQYILGVDLYDDSFKVQNVEFYTDTGCANTGLVTDGLSTEVSDGDDFTIDNLEKTTQTIRCIKYSVLTGDGATPIPYQFNNSDYPDYFKVGGAAWRVFSNN